MANNDQSTGTISQTVVTTPTSNNRVVNVGRTLKRVDRYWWWIVSLSILTVASIWGLLAYDNPMPPGSEGFLQIAQMRQENILTIIVVAFCQSIATVIFQTGVANRIITPSIMGFESLYVLIHTSTVFFFGTTALVYARGLNSIILESLIMIGFAAALYGWLFSGKLANLHIMLMVGVVLGGGLSSISTFMQRVLDPNVFDILMAKLFGSISNSRPEYLGLAYALCIVVGLIVWLKARHYDALALGRDTATNLGLNHRWEIMKILFLVSLLMSITTTMVGPLTFLGFLVATLAYQLAGTHEHRKILPMAFLLALVILLGAYFVMKHIFYAEGVVSVLIEFGGGLFFLIYVLRKGML